MRSVKIGIRLLIALGLVTAPTLRAQETLFKVVVPAAMPGATIKRAMLADVFFKKITRWGDGTAISPVDQSAASAVRISFSKQVLGKPVAGVQIYWMRQMSAPGGSSPPSVKSSDDDVIAFVEAKPGAIGYVSEAAPLPPAVKELRVTE